MFSIEKNYILEQDELIELLKSKLDKAHSHNKELKAEVKKLHEKVSYNENDLMRDLDEDKESLARKLEEREKQINEQMFVITDLEEKLKISDESLDKLKEELEESKKEADKKIAELLSKMNDFASSSNLSESQKEEKEKAPEIEGFGFNNTGDSDFDSVTFEDEEINKLLDEQSDLGEIVSLEDIDSIESQNDISKNTKINKLNPDLDDEEEIEDELLEENIIDSEQDDEIFDEEESCKNEDLVIWKKAATNWYKTDKNYFDTDDYSNIERKNLIFVFVSLEGFSSILNKISEESANKFIENWIELNNSEAVRKRGIIDSIVNTSIMTVFGFENDIESRKNAFEYALEIKEYTKNIISEIDDIDEKDIKLQIGIHSGEISCRKVDTENTNYFITFGDNIAITYNIAHLNTKLNSNILCSEASIIDFSEDMIRLEDKGVVNVKGRDEKILLYELKELY